MKTQFQSDNLVFQEMESPLGKLFLVGDKSYLFSILFEKEWGKKRKSFNLSEGKSPALQETKSQLQQYFNGKLKKFNVPLKLTGTDFQKLSWNTLQKIKYGTTISYSEQAKLAKAPMAIRAIGSANGKNPIPIIVPCHRVVAKSGGIGGYSGGLNIKRQLLEIEKVDARSFLPK